MNDFLPLGSHYLWLLRILSKYQFTSSDPKSCVQIFCTFGSSSSLQLQSHVNNPNDESSWHLSNPFETSLSRLPYSFSCDLLQSWYKHVTSNITYLQPYWPSFPALCKPNFWFYIIVTSNAKCILKESFPKFVYLVFNIFSSDNITDNPQNALHELLQSSFATWSMFFRLSLIRISKKFAFSFLFNCVLRPPCYLLCAKAADWICSFV